MPAWLLLALASMVLVGTADLLLRRATLHGITVASFMVLQSWFFGPTALAWAGATGTLRWSPGVLWGPVAGVLAWANAAVPVSQMSFVFTFLLAAPLFGEAVTTRKLTGLGAAVHAILAFYR